MTDRPVQPTANPLTGQAAPGALSLVSLAYQAGLKATRRLHRDEQKQLGQYMTPAAIAHRMADRATADLHGRLLRILDPAAGTGVLAFAAVEALLRQPAPPARIELMLCEIDDRLHDSLESGCAELRKRCAAVGVALDTHISGGDFLLSGLALAQRPCVDLVIANPPYFKLGKSDPRARAHAYAVHGQPNIYGLFMAACAGLVRPGGVWCFITPRSWTGGDYFAAVRRHVFARLQLRALHAFDSRTEHFGDDEVLQEALIVWAQSAATSGHVEISTSAGVADMARAAVRRVPLDAVLRRGDAHRLHLPSDRRGLETLTESFASLGLKVFTGPVVAFRAKAWLSADPGADTVPMLWMQHVQRMALQWPMARKLEHLRADAASAWMLVPNQVMVLLRRFSPKEDVRRVTAAPCLAEWRADRLGIENHLNCIAPVGRTMSCREAIGLAAFLNSRPVDEHLRAVSGHTQINASDLRMLPMPDLAGLLAIGARVGDGRSLVCIDAAVDAVLSRRLSLVEPGGHRSFRLGMAVIGGIGFTSAPVSPNIASLKRRR